MPVPSDLAVRYQRDGYYVPIDAVAPKVARGVLDRIDRVTPAEQARASHPWLYKSYLLLRPIADLARAPGVLDAIEAVLGPDIVAISADIWIKEPGTGRHVSWHQDAQYYAIKPMAVVNAWVALTDATVENGCMRFVPGSHTSGLRRHVNRPNSNNMLSHGQTLDPPVDEARAEAAPLRAGQMSLHHGYLAHASGPNDTDGRRVGIAIKYIPASARPTGGPRMTGLLVRGRDHGHFGLERAPAVDFDDAAVAEHTRVMAPHAATRYMNF
ncbi:MAG: phytanoyl-CoA dioxygenase family protein [Alphaproteobacteria bacterium]|nr:phytanoyl-CoA dioxygenase family protein [Alphaproteobacteria bacterium]